jgi:hypothetical protein
VDRGKGTYPIGAEQALDERALQRYFEEASDNRVLKISVIINGELVLSMARDDRKWTTTTAR